MTLQSYAKVLAVGSVGTEALFEGRVVIQEKVDGSQFRFGRDETGALRMASHHQELFGEGGQFAAAMAHVERVAERIPAGYWFFAEYLAKPKQNTLAYGRVPTNHLVLFDGWRDGGAMLDLAYWARLLEIDEVPTLHDGPATLETARALLTAPSYLGNVTIEGVVIKNYGQFIALGGRSMPLFCKLVNEQFKEKNVANWASESRKNKVDEFVASFATEARWRKAVQHLAEQGRLLGEPKDIGALMREVHDDLVAEEEENIKAALFKLYISDICRAAQRGLPEWYKAQLAERVKT